MIYVNCRSLPEVHDKQTRAVSAMKLYVLAGRRKVAIIRYLVPYRFPYNDTR